jgi:hypothetical protein
MAKASRKYKRTQRKVRKHRGGGSGIGGYAFTGASIMPGLGNAAVNQPMESCLAAPRFGETTVTPGGLPGMVGGRYGFDLTSQITPGTPFLGGIPPVMKIPCEAATANPLNPQLGGAPGGVGSPFYTAPTAGYDNQPSSWTASTGAPVLLQVPYDAKMMNPACLKTGGARKKSRKSKGKSRKGKKATRRR